MKDWGPEWGRWRGSHYTHMDRWFSPFLSSSIESATRLPSMLMDAEGHSPAAALVRRLIASSSEFLATAEIQLQKSAEADGSNKLIHSGDTVSWRTGIRTGLHCWRRKWSVVSVRIKMIGEEAIKLTNGKNRLSAQRRSFRDVVSDASCLWHSKSVAELLRGTELRKALRALGLSLILCLSFFELPKELRRKQSRMRTCYHTQSKGENWPKLPVGKRWVSKASISSHWRSNH